jgi:hypothetical protein
MPAQQGFGGDEEGPPPASRQEPTQPSKQSAIGGPVPETSMELTFEDLHLMAENHNLDVLVRFRPLFHHQVEDPAHRQVEESERHGR